ncbi:MAG: GGDEF domain-containing protein, partial [Spirochaetia bacterium]|nr:GGDEF domain-containing protein [Spirochaetia bacterium]
RNPQRRFLTKFFFIAGIIFFPPLSFIDFNEGYFIMAFTQAVVPFFSLLFIYKGILKSHIDSAQKTAIVLLALIMFSGLPYVYNNIANFMWLGFFPFLLYYMGGLLTGTALSLTFGIFLIGGYFLWPYFDDAQRISELHAVQALAVFTSSLLLAFFYEKQRRIYEYNLLFIAERDSLTGVLNRRGLIRLKDYINGRLERNILLSVLLLDIDHFKQINDSYGHDAGDRVLIELTGMLKNKLRKDDWIIRLGGEEFLILLEGIGKQQAVKIAEKLRNSVNHYPFTDIEKLSISLGVDEYSKEMSFDELYKNVDDALYEAKKSGRNCVKVYEKIRMESAS